MTSLTDTYYSKCLNILQVLCAGPNDFKGLAKAVSLRHLFGSIATLTTLISTS